LKLVVGLGNPGPEYVWSRHNAGWLLIDSFVSKAGLREPRMKFSGAFWPRARIEGEALAFLKPFTYMNQSGKSVSEASRYYDVPPSDILVLFDDTALPFGKLRYRASGSAGGQKGMMSILGVLGTLDVPRLRAGVDSPDASVGMKDWVLGKFTKSQRESWPQVESLAWDSLLKWLSGAAGDGFTVQITAAESKG
jgi:PTH1 family peptidyl-tRNA hydrolase